MTPTRIRRIAAAFLAASGLSWPAVSEAAVVQEVRVSFNPATITVDETTDLRIEVKTSQGNINAGMDVEVPLRGLSSVGEMTFEGCDGAPNSVSTGTSVIISGLKSHPGRTCLMSIRIGADAPGTYEFAEGAVVVTSEGRTTGNSETATLVVLAAPPAILVASQSSLAFGPQLVGTPSAAQAITLRNDGASPLLISSVSTSGDFDHAGCDTPAILPGDSCTVSVTFAPTTFGSRAGALQVVHGAGSPLVIALSGTGIEAERTLPRISLVPSSQDFGTTTAGSTVLLRVELRSTGTEALIVSSIGVTGGAFSESNDCPGSLPPGAACEIWVAFAPLAAGPHDGALIVGSNAAEGSGTVPLSGDALPAPEPEPLIALSRATIDFGAQTLGTAANPQAVVVSNPGAATVQITSIAVSGDFGFEGCTPRSLAALESCELTVTFLPTATGARTGTISIHSNAPDSPHALSLTGTGTPMAVPGIVVAPSSVDFGSIRAGASAVTHLALTNNGSAPLVISGISTSAAMFTHSSTCPEILAPNAACDISVTYAPAGEGGHSAELHVVSNALPGPLVVPLFGFATPAPTPLLDLSSTSVAFPPIFVGQTSAPRTVTLSNYGLEPLKISDITSMGDFGYAGCGAATTLLNGESCTFSITSRPLAIGARTGAIEVRSNAPGSPHTISLSGAGVSFAQPEISLNPSHLSFGAQPVGGNVVHVMTLTNAGGAALQVSEISATGAFFTQANDCPASMAVGASCRITVAYAPTAIGAHSGQVLILSNAQPANYVVPLSGSATTSAPAFLSTDRAVDFGEQVLGETARETLLLVNAGGEPLHISWARILGEPEFEVTNRCGTILPGASCALEVRFTPTALGGFIARLDILSNHSAGMVQIPLRGEGVPRPRARLKLSVEGLGWGNQVVGSTGEARVVQVTSTGGEGLRIHSVHAGPDFVVDAAQCPELLEPKASCDIAVNFKPLVPGRRLSRLLIISNAVESDDSVSLSGVGCRFFTMGAARNPSRLCAP